MICDDIRAAIAAGDESPETLSHVRSCVECLEAAIAHDPDWMFRSIGGEIEPPGGAEAFAADVMHQIHVRQTERQFAPGESRLTTLHRWALAVAATLVIASSALFWPSPSQVELAPINVAAVEVEAAQVAVVRPVVESYDSSTAMIIEVPQEETSDLRVVMIFDESLPADI